MSIELPAATRHLRDMTEKLLKATLNPNKQTTTASIGNENMQQMETQKNTTGKAIKAERYVALLMRNKGKTKCQKMTGIVINSDARLERLTEAKPPTQSTCSSEIKRAVCRRASIHIISHNIYPHLIKVEFKR